MQQREAADAEKSSGRKDQIIAKGKDKMIQEGEKTDDAMCL